MSQDKTSITPPEAGLQLRYKLNLHKTETVFTNFLPKEIFPAESKNKADIYQQINTFSNQKLSEITEAVIVLFTPHVFFGLHVAA